LKQVGLQPAIAAGHSAGAAILLQMCLDGLIVPRSVVSLNGALLPFASHGTGRSFFAPLAKLFATNPLVPMLFSWQAADSKVVEKLLASTGSTISREGVGFYARLARRSGHAGAALKMMANWGLTEFSAKLSKVKTPLLLIVGSQDRSIPPSEADRVQRRIEGSRVVRMQGLGHLAHEEKPQETCEMIVKFAHETGVFDA
jgi:magnesium chelatase accessory protein